MSVHAHAMPESQHPPSTYTPFGTPIHIEDGRAFYFSNDLQTDAIHSLRDKLDLLIARDHKEFDGVDLKGLRSKLDQIRVFIYSGEPFIASGVRAAAVNFAKQGFILLHYDRTKKYSAKQILIILFHEALGALGYHDDNYLLTACLFMKLQEPNRPLSPFIEQRMRRQFDKPKITQNQVLIASGGGATSVGAGGDGVTAEVKVHVLSLLNQSHPTLSIESQALLERIMEDVINTHFESFEFRDRYGHIIEYGRLGIGLNKLTTNFDILINTDEWNPVMSLNSITRSNMELLEQIAIVLRAGPINPSKSP
ncbi:MAG: hypothetical protein RBT63_11770 [Bdellovibrionales bacterium]|nr:hypothetical protein [Bdellovibrionales bacterium]